MEPFVNLRLAVGLSSSACSSSSSSSQSWGSASSQFQSQPSPFEVVQHALVGQRQRLAHLEMEQHWKRRRSSGSKSLWRRFWWWLGCSIVTFWDCCSVWRAKAIACRDIKQYILLSSLPPLSSKVANTKLILDTPEAVCFTTSC